MTKQEAIQQAYGEHWDAVKGFVDENGFCHQRKNIDFDKIFCSMDIDLPGYEWRPKSLQGIENNNGWEEIYSDDRIPNEDMWLIDKKRNITFSPMDEYIPKEHNYTHYQPIVKPEPPIY